MNFEEFLEKKEDAVEAAATPAPAVEAEEQIEETDIAESIDVQKAVVESLAADKAEQDEKINELRAENEALKSENESLKKEGVELKNEIETLKNNIQQLERKCAEQGQSLASMGDVLSKNADTAMSNKVALLDRDTDIPDRFPGETREHVLEVVAEARKKAEEEGRIRRAQVLEGVLMANESEGILAEKRAELEKLFAENANILSGPVIEELQNKGIPHKNGEEYLLPAEIIKRMY
jgi:predicted RNase H-like nuclease (RuvC/YqgF family)